MHKVLIVGCGSIGERHLRCFQKTGRAAVTACDTNPVLLKKMADTYGAPGVAGWEEALGLGFEAAVICTPANWHVPMALKALGRGLHVLCEKPLSQSLTGVDELLQAERKSGRQAAVAYVLQVYPFLAQARAFVRSEEIGPVREVSVRSGQAFHRLRPGYAQTYYRDRRTGGGAIQDALTHFSNWVESVLGPTDSLYCDCAHLAVPEVEVEDTVHIAARNGGVLVSYALNQFQAPNETTIQFNGERGSVMIEVHNQRWGVFRDGGKGWSWNEGALAERDTHFIAEADAFLDQVEGKPRRLCSMAEAAQSLRFNLAALASAESGARVLLKDLHA